MIPDVSIIVPCYNVAAYVDSCLESLVRQTLRNIEIICINDGSTDETWIHLLRWKEKDSRIILLNQRNAGVSAARNAGLDAARGLYVGFADPDDYMDPEMYSRLFSAALEYDADIVECGNHVFEDSSDRLIEAKRRSPSRHFEENASPASFFRDSIWGKMDICVWSKLFRKSMLDAHRLRFNVHLKSGAEDETFRLMAVPHASRLLFIPDCLYYYRLMRNGSLSRRCNVPTYSKCVQEFQRLLYIVDYWQKQGWQNEGLFAYGVRKIRPFFVSKHPLFHQMTAVQQRSALNLWKLFYQKAEGERFLSFADSRMSAALERLGRQAEALDFFDEITLFTEHDLSAEFTSRMGRYLTPSCRGFGYWSWKPWSIHHVLQEMEEGDRLLYLDAGCHINANGTDRFREYVNMLDRDSCGMLVFTNGQPEYKWTKGDIFRHFGVSQEDGHITHTQQIAGGHVFLKKNPLTESLIRDWLHVFYDHLHLADNTPSASPNLPGFVENRYDQSIFSILCKLRGITTLDGSETYAENWEQLSLFPFQDRRDMGIPRAGKKGWLEKCRQLLLSSKRNGLGIR